MDLSDATIQAMVNYLQQTMSHDANIRRPAEKYLEAVEVNQNYPLVLLHLIDKIEIELVIRISGAITFKNYIKRNWTDADGTRISQQDRQAIKNTIIDVMLKREDQIQRQLSDAVAIIGKEDFPKKWPQLLSELVARIRTSNANFQIINGILQTLHSLFKRFRHEFKSDELFTTIKYVLDHFSVPFTELFVATTNLAANAQRDNNEQTLKVLFSSLVLCAKVFYSLNAQDLPEEFEDRLDIWMPHFLKLLDTEIRILETESEDEVGLLQQLKSEICDIISMFAQKYHEEFEKYLPDFVEAVWKLLTTSGQEPKFDNLISNAIKFLSTVANRPQFKSLFEKPGVLDGLCSKVIIPNIELRQCDIELFEDNCEDYIRADIEGSDVDTRRKSACDLVKSLARHFEENIVRVFSEYIKVMLDSFATNPQTFWKNKDAAIYLVTAICVRGSTARYGTTQTTDLVNVVEFYNTFVKSDIDNQDNINNLPVLRADALKYIMTFRNQLPVNDIILPTLPIIIKHLSSQSVVVHTYAAIAIEKILTMKNQNRTNVITAEHIQPVLEQLITGLFCALQLEGSSENEYIMKAIMRTIATSRNSISPYLNAILSQLNTKLAEVCRNPSKPYFNHYLFESIALSLQVAVNSDPNSAAIVENTIFQMSDGIFTADVQEFLPYIIQLLSLLTEYNNTNQIPDRYLQLLTYVISPILWDKTGNIHPLVRLLKAFIRKSPQQIIDSGRLEAILGIFQKLVASRANDHEGLDLLQCLFNELPIDALKNFVKDVFVILFTRLTSSKTTKYVTMLIVFISFFTYKFGPQSLEDVIESIQPKMFGMLIDKVLITDSQKIEGKPERRIACVGLTRLLCESVSLLDGDYSMYWPKLLETIVSIFELPADSEQYQEEFTIDLEDTLSYQTSYSKLIFAPVPPYEVLGNDVPEDVRLYLASNLNKLSLSRPGVILNRISQNIDPKIIEHLNNYFQSANLTIS